ncbi:MAG: M16 family metallopeptidase [Anaerolineales bacterium]|jgi:zinc protease
MTSDVTSLQLANGLRVLLKEIHTAPIISQWIWYRVGSRDEQPGLTGVSHWVEHMQFKGTPRFPGGTLDRAISRVGGYWNAMTYIDWTTYYETLPAQEIDLALQLEADRMANSLFDPHDVEAERNVIISERQGNENEPLFQLGEQIQAAAFRAHPYGHETIGSLDDLQHIQREDLYQHYRTYYTPGNAVLALAGDFETGQLLARIQELYAGLPAGPEPVNHQVAPEPPRSEGREVIVSGPGETTYVQLAYPVPEASHPDFFPLMVLDSLLCGPSSLNMFGGGISNKTSRLYQALVDGELAVGVYGGMQATIDPFLYTILLTVHPRSRAEACLQAVEAEIERLQERPTQVEELSRAAKQARALFAYGSESISNQAFWLGYAEMFAEYAWFLEYLERLEAVTPADVQRVAQTYLRPGQRVLGIYRPTGEAHG